MLTDDKVIDLWMKLSNEFNVHVRSIGAGMNKDGNECTVVSVDDKTDPAVVATLPAKFANEQVEYKLIAAPSAYSANPPCGAEGHQCGCSTPKP